MDPRYSSSRQRQSFPKVCTVIRGGETSPSSISQLCEQCQHAHDLTCQIFFPIYTPAKGCVPKTVHFTSSATKSKKPSPYTAFGTAIAAQSGFLLDRRCACTLKLLNRYKTDLRVGITPARCEKTFLTCSSVKLPIWTVRSRHAKPDHDISSGAGS